MEMANLIAFVQRLHNAAAVPADGLADAQYLALVVVASRPFAEFLHRHTLPGDLLVQGFFVEEEVLNGNRGALPLRLRAGQEEVGAVTKADAGSPYFPELRAHGGRRPEHWG